MKTLRAKKMKTNIKSNSIIFSILLSYDSKIEDKNQTNNMTEPVRIVIFQNLI